MPLDFTRVAPYYDLLNDAISFGLHRTWKRKLVRRLQEEGVGSGAILDIASGTGDVALLLARDFSNPVVAVEPCETMLARGWERTGEKVSWVRAESEALPLSEGTASAITCSFGVRNFTDRVKAFREWGRVLGANGVCAVLEIHPPHWTLGRILMKWHWRVVVPVLGALLGRGAEYQYLRDSVEKFVSPSELAEEARVAGLMPAGTISLFGKGMVSISVFRKP